MERLSRHPFVGIFGTRRCGKTTIARQVVAGMSRKSEYIDLASFAARNFLADPGRYVTESDSSFFILDNVDGHDDIVAWLRSEIERNEGRKRFVGLSARSDSFAGFDPAAILELTPFLLSEVGSGARQALWFRGGYPEAFNAQTDKAASAWFERYILETVEGRSGLSGVPWAPGRALAILSMLADRHGETLNESAISRSAGISRPAVGRAVDDLEARGLVRLVPSVVQSPKKRVQRGPSLYIRDSGLLHVLAGLESREALLRSSRLAASWEGFVIEQICAGLPAGCGLARYRTQDGAGFEAVLTRAGEPVVGLCVRWARTTAIPRGALEAAADLGVRERLVVTQDGDERDLGNGFAAVPLHKTVERIDSIFSPSRDRMRP